MQWFRFYDSILNSPKVMFLPKEIRWDFVAVLCVANQNDTRGFLPVDDKTIAFKIRSTLEEWEKSKKILLENKLIEENENGLFIAGWDEKQFESDNAAERMRKFREQKRINNEPVKCKLHNNAVTCSERNYSEQNRAETDTKTDTEQNILQKIYMFKTNQTEREDLQAISRITGDTWPEFKNIPIQKPVDLHIWQAAQVIKQNKGHTISGMPFLQALDTALKNLIGQKWFVDCGGPYWLLSVTNDQYNGQQAEIRIAKYLKHGRDAPNKSVTQNNNFGDGQPFHVEKF